MPDLEACGRLALDSKLLEIRANVGIEERNAMAKVLYERDGRIARITLNRPEVLNAIDDDLPRELAAAVERADADEAVHVIVLAGAGRAFCAGYDLMHYAQPRRRQRYHPGACRGTP